MSERIRQQNANAIGRLLPQKLPCETLLRPWEVKLSLGDHVFGRCTSESSETQLLRPRSTHPESCLLYDILATPASGLFISVFLSCLRNGTECFLSNGTFESLLSNN